MKKPNSPALTQSDRADPSAVQGEGDYKSARTYGEAAQSFARSGKVAEAAKAARPATPQEQQDLLAAERVGVSHSKGEDPASPRAPTRKSPD